MLKMVSFHIQAHLNTFMDNSLGPLATESPCNTVNLSYVRTSLNLSADFHLSTLIGYAVLYPSISCTICYELHGNILMPQSIPSPKFYLKSLIHVSFRIYSVPSEPWYCRWLAQYVIILKMVLVTDYQYFQLD
jgi:hypothetical protein